MAEYTGGGIRWTTLLVLLMLHYLLGVPLWLVLLIGIWYSALVVCETMGILDRMDATRVLGAILMLRTRRGKRVLEAVSSSRGFWRAYGEFSIWLCFFVMAGVVMVVGVMVVVVLVVVVMVVMTVFGMAVGPVSKRVFQRSVSGCH